MCYLRNCGNLGERGGSVPSEKRLRSAFYADSPGGLGVSRSLRLLMVLIASALAGCAKAPSPKVDATSATYQQTNAVGAISPSTVSGVGTAAAVPTPHVLLASGGASSGDSSDYQIAPLDVLEITVFQVPDLGGTFPVSVNGQIDMPLIGPVMASGKTLEELKAEITQRLGASYLQSPNVSVAMKDAVSQRIVVEGAVAKPGVYPTTGPTTLMEVVALAGGLDRATADERGIIVFRKVGGKRQAAKFDYKAIRQGKADDPVIGGGDVVVVDESGMKSALHGLKDSLGLFGFFAPLI